jgi:hypothetical protein
MVASLDDVIVMNVQLRHGLHGLGEEEYFDPEMEGIDWEYVTEPDSTTTLVTGGGYVGVPITTPGGGYVGVTPVQGSTAFDPAKLLQMLTTGAVQVSKLTAAGKPACPSGYQYPNGGCVPPAVPGGASKPILAGVSNQTLAIGVGVAFLFMMMAGGRRR